MIKLLRELFEKICIQLQQKDKIVYLIVYRTWKYDLENTTLFKVVHLKKIKQLRKLTEVMVWEPSPRQRVERLIIEMEEMCITEIVFFSLFVFQNIVTLYLTITELNLPFIKLLSLHTWFRTIKRIRDRSPLLITVYILKGDIAPCLTALKVLSGQYIQYIFPLFDYNNCHLKEFTVMAVLSESKIEQIVQSSQA
ncbi:hypothetical protein K501DRAFT_268476 [Backusella circina FSU 941]|nr:hypothetical protein K501DRAFT_268476 [Backusella circina FSU 941]